MENKARFMCTYGGEIKRDDGDSHFFCDGGDHKILHVDRGISFKDMIAEISALYGGAAVLSFKYQIPGDELDTIVSVSNERDLGYMMRELYLHDATETGRIRIFLFPENLSPSSLLSGPAKPDPVDNGAVVPPLPEHQPRVAVNTSDQVVVSDPLVKHALLGQWPLQWKRVAVSWWFIITLPVLLFFFFTLALQHRSIMGVDSELKNVGVFPEPGPGHALSHVDKPRNQWSLQRHQSLPDKAGGLPVYPLTVESAFQTPWGPSSKGQAGCADTPSYSSSLFGPLTAVEFQVFISFRGKDTRINFVCHLYEALIREEIKVLIDYKLPRGDEIWPSLFKAIENANVSVVVFSKNYASSKWCLEELVKILECRKEHGQVVIPVFYDVDPSHVRKQIGSYEEAFEKHQQNFMFDMNQVQKWKDALTEAAYLFGRDSGSRYSRDDAELIQQIVKDVLAKRVHRCKSND